MAGSELVGSRKAGESGAPLVGGADGGMGAGGAAVSVTGFAGSSAAVRRGNSHNDLQPLRLARGLARQFPLYEARDLSATPPGEIPLGAIPASDSVPALRDGSGGIDFSSFINHPKRYRGRAALKSLARRCRYSAADAMGAEFP